jgi:hypothetical protein
MSRAPVTSAGPAWPAERDGGEQCAYRYETGEEAGTVVAEAAQCVVPEEEGGRGDDRAEVAEDWGHLLGRDRWCGATMVGHGRLVLRPGVQRGSRPSVGPSLFVRVGWT